MKYAVKCRQNDEDALYGVFNVRTQDYTKKHKSVLQRKFKALWKGSGILPDKFEVSRITGFVKIDRYGNIKIPYSIICEMFGSMTKAVGKEFSVHWERDTNKITIELRS